MKNKFTSWSKDVAGGPVKATLDTLSMWKMLHLFHSQSQRQFMSDVKVRRCSGPHNQLNTNTPSPKTPALVQR